MVLCFSSLLCSSSWPSTVPLGSWRVQLCFTKAHTPDGVWPKTCWKSLEKSRPSPWHQWAQAHALSGLRTWIISLPTQERPPCTHDSAPVTLRFRITFSEKPALVVSRVTSSSQAPSMHKSLSLEVICPSLGGPPGMGRMGHVRLSCGTLSAAAHLPRMGWVLLLPHEGSTAAPQEQQLTGRSLEPALTQAHP